MRRGARSRISESGEIGKVVDYTECFFAFCLPSYVWFICLLYHTRNRNGRMRVWFKWSQSDDAMIYILYYYVCVLRKNEEFINLLPLLIRCELYVYFATTTITKTNAKQHNCIDVNTHSALHPNEHVEFFDFLPLLIYDFGKKLSPQKCLQTITSVGVSRLPLLLHFSFRFCLPNSARQNTPK